jgi:hypothetical protein
MSASLAAQAIEFLVKRRWPMLPSSGMQKKPCVGWKQFQDQLPAVEQLRAWAGKFKPVRWGVVTGALAGIVVVDFDGDEGRALMERWGLKPHVRTGSGGFHCYLHHPGWHVPTLNAKSSKGSWPWPGLDIRGDGGFAILLGKNSNGLYVHLRDLVPEPFDALPEEVRAFLHDRSEEGDAPKPPDARQRTAPGGRRRPDVESQIGKALAMAPCDGRNNSGFWLACQLRDNGYSIGEAEAALRDYRSRVPSVDTKGKRTAYTVAEMKASVNEAYSKPARQPWERRKSNQASETKPLLRPKLTTGDAPNSENEEGAHDESADDPDSIDVYVGYTGSPEAGYTGIPVSRRGYARVPREVYTDRRLKAVDVRVYCVLASACWQGNVVSVGKRLIAREGCCAECKVADILRRLEAAGHIQKQPEPRHGRRAFYVLLSSVFGQKQRAGVEEVAKGPSGPRLVSSPRKQDCA